MEVVIVGGGPAGVITGLNLLERGISPLILEKGPEIVSTTCAEGCNLTSLKKIPFDFSPYISKEVKGVKFIFPSDNCFSCNIAGVVLDRDRWLKGMAAAFRKRGGDLRTHAHVSAIHKKFVVLRNGEKIEYETLVGADGSFSLVGKSMGIKQEMICGVQYKIKCDTSGMDHLHFYFDKRFSFIYSWVFPKKNSVNIGLTGKFTQLDTFLEYRGFKKKDILKKEAGALPVSGIPRKIVGDDRALIGDAASMTNPLSSGGLSPIIYASALLSEHINDLERYEREIKSHPMASPLFLKAKNKLVHLTNHELTAIGKLFDGKTLEKINFFDFLALVRHPFLISKTLRIGKGVSLAMKWGW